MSLLTNLVGVWCEAALPVTDETGNGLTLTNHGTVGTTAGKIGTAGDFGTGSSTKFLDRASEAALETGDIDVTFAAWVNATALTKLYPSIICKVVGDGATVEYQLIYNGNGSALQFEFLFGATDLVRATTFGTPSTGTWYYVVAWHDSVGNTVNIQVNNGTADSNAHTTGTTIRATANFAIGTLGSYTDADSTWDGLINQAAMWKRVLTAPERTQLYNAGSGLAFASWAGPGVAAPISRLQSSARTRASNY